MLRDELVIAKTVDFLVEHATPVSPALAADEPDDADATSDEAAAQAESEAGKAGKSGKTAAKASAPKRRPKKTSEQRCPGRVARAGHRKERIEK